MRSTWAVVMALVLVLLACGSSVGYAADAASSVPVTLSLTKDYTASPWTKETGYSNQVIGKLGFGLKNLLLGWTDLFREPHEAATSGGNVLVGIGTGIKDTIENELGGAVHVITFFLPQVDVPLPEGGVQF